MSWRGVRVGGCGGRRVTGEGSQVGLNMSGLEVIGTGGADSVLTFRHALWGTIITHCT